MVTGVSLIADERHRQIMEEKWTQKHDDGHVADTLARAGACYALPIGLRWSIPSSGIPILWPFGEAWWKPSSGRLRDLAKAGALIAAEMDVILRKQAKREAEAKK